MQVTMTNAMRSPLYVRSSDMVIKWWQKQGCEESSPSPTESKEHSHGVDLLVTAGQKAACYAQTAGPLFGSGNMESTSNFWSTDNCVASNLLNQLTSLIELPYLL